jgi:quinol monooxygenase YgiN
MIANASVQFGAVKRHSRQDYRDAIDSLTNAMGQLEPDGKPCAVCGSGEHQAWECRHNPLACMYDWSVEQTHWRCFQCGEVFTNEEAAKLHFDVTDANAPACMQTLRDDLRDFAVLMENKLRKHDNEFHVDDYKRHSIDRLFNMLEQHIFKAQRQGTRGAWADVANFAMMIAYHCEE